GCWHGVPLRESRHGPPKAALTGGNRGRGSCPDAVGPERLRTAVAGPSITFPEPSQGSTHLRRVHHGAGSGDDTGGRGAGPALGDGPALEGDRAHVLRRGRGPAL